ncbi:response regulator [Desulfococcaceae bacterium HSG7]|nr:response regulator [Desulfococcaceae bacterium HSG7]
MDVQDRKPKVIIIDDGPENIRMLIEILKEDYATIPATSGEAGLAKAMIAPLPDLILLDIMMPGIDGYEVCKRLKAIEQTKDIPVVFITAISEAMDNAKAFNLGAADYITKPFYASTIKARVKNHIKLRKTVLEMDLTIHQLKGALKEIKTLSGLIPICANCKKIRDDKGYWQQVERYIKKHSDAEFSHSICPDCVSKLYVEFKEVVSE